MNDEESERQRKLRELFDQTPSNRWRSLRDKRTGASYGVVAITRGKPYRYIVQRPSQVFEEWTEGHLSEQFQWEML